MTEKAIYFENLEPAIQKEICDRFQITPEEQYWDLFPLIIIKNYLTEEQ